MLRRIHSLDVTRGLAMVLAILQHSYLSANSALFSDSSKWFIWTTTNFAPIAFVAVSGAASSYTLFLRPCWHREFRRNVVRAFLLLTLAHFLINLLSYPWVRNQWLLLGSDLPLFQHLLLGFPITDTIAVCLIVSPVLVSCTGYGLRATLIAVLIAVTVGIDGLAAPDSAPSLFLREALFGGVGDFRGSGEPKVFWWPLIPWLGVFLSGSFFGEVLARFVQGKLDANTLTTLLVRWSIALGLLCIVLSIGYKFLKAQYLLDWGPEIFRAMYPTRITTLLPGYLAVLALVIAFVTYMVDVRGHFDQILWLLSVFGRTSLFAFSIQFLFVESMPAVLGFTGSLGFIGFALLFIFGLISVWMLSYLFGRLSGKVAKSDYASCKQGAFLENN